MDRCHQHQQRALGACQQYDMHCALLVLGVLTLLEAPLMLEIIRQSCQLPMSHADTIKKSLDLFKAWFSVRAACLLYYFVDVSSGCVQERPLRGSLARVLAGMHAHMWLTCLLIACVAVSAAERPPGVLHSQPARPGGHTPASVQARAGTGQLLCDGLCKQAGAIHMV